MSPNPIWSPMGRIGSTDDDVVVGELTADEQAVADRWSRADIRTAPITVTFQAEPSAMRDMQLLLGLVTTLAPREVYL